MGGRERGRDSPDNNLVTAYFVTYGAEQQLVTLASTMDPTLLMCVAVYVHKCLLKRNVLLNCLCSD